VRRAGYGPRVTSIVPDTKDWTWVLDRPCPECGYDAAQVPAQDVAGRLQANADAWAEVLGRPDVRQRRRPDQWSPLEYGCHVRDVFRLYLARLDLMLDSDDPLYPNWDQDRTAIESDYAAQDPATVSVELVAAGQALADRFRRVSGVDWQRRGRRSDGASFTVDTFSRYLLHDVVHHLWDVQ
jgi:hypothetical protein